MQSTEWEKMLRYIQNLHNTNKNKTAWFKNGQKPWVGISLKEKVMQVGNQYF